MISFRDHTVIVTGAGRGLGKSHALLFASLGANVVLNDAALALDGSQASDHDDVSRTVEEIRGLGHGVMVSNHDVTDSEAVDEMVAEAVDEFGALHAVVCNAGFIRDRSLVNLSDDDLRDVIDVHLMGSALVARAAMRAFRTQKYGRIVMISSGAGLYGNPGQSNYGAAKMGVVGLTKVLALEGSRSDVRVNAVAPAAITRMTESLNLGRATAHLDPDRVSPIVAVLASAECPTNGEIYEAGAGNFRRVVIGATPGWFSGLGGAVSPDELLAQWDRITDLTGLDVPTDAIAANRSLFRPLLEELKR